MKVVVQIDRLVLSDEADGHRVEAAIGEAIRRELMRPGAVQALAQGDRTTVDAGRVRAERGPAAIGTAIGRSLGKERPR